MLNPEAMVIQTGAAVLLAIGVARIALHEFNNLLNDFREKRKHR
jgi:hypothetical protein